MPQVSRFRVGSGLIYPRRSCTTPACVEAREWIWYSIKQARADAIPGTLQKILKAAPGTDLEEFLGEAGVLIPVPGSAPRVKDGLWVPQLICDGLTAAGVGQGVSPVLSRRARVAKSSSSGSADDRPDPETHRASLDCAADLLLTGSARALLVDDVVTRGSTMMGCILRLHEEYPDLEVEGFALARVEPAQLQDTADMLSTRLESVTYDPRGASIVRGV